MPRCIKAVRAIAAAMSDEELVCALGRLKDARHLTAFQRAMIDEATRRKLML